MVMQQSVRSYYNNVRPPRRRIPGPGAGNHPGLWLTYESTRWGFRGKLQSYTLYSPNTGLYLLDEQGRVLASSSDGSRFHGGYKVDMKSLRDSWPSRPADADRRDDPDQPGRSCIVAARPIQSDGQVGGWLYMVSRTNRPAGRRCRNCSRATRCAPPSRWACWCWRSASC